MLEGEGWVTVGRSACTPGPGPPGRSQACGLPGASRAPGDAPGGLRLLAMSSELTSLSLLVRGALELG